MHDESLMAATPGNPSGQKLRAGFLAARERTAALEMTGWTLVTNVSIRSATRKSFTTQVTEAAEVFSCSR
jgi:hypothetical protein